MKRKLTIVGVSLFLVIALLACAAPAPAPNPAPAPTGTTETGVTPTLPANFKGLKIAAGSVGGDFYAYSEALAKVYNRELGIIAEAQPTTGSVENTRLLRDGIVDMAPINAKYAGFAREGIGNFSGEVPYPGFRALAGIFSFTGTDIALKKSGKPRFVDWKGTNFVYSGGPTPVTADEAARPVFEAHGFDWESINRIYAETDELYRMLSEGRVDVIRNALGGMQPEPGYIELTSSYEVVVLEYDVDMLKAAGIPVTFMPKGTVPGLLKDQWGYKWGDVALVVTDRLPNDVAYMLTKEFHENLKELAELTPAAVEAIFNPQLLTTDDLPIVYHPGAVRYWQDVGEWGKY